MFLVISLGGGILHLFTSCQIKSKRDVTHSHITQKITSLHILHSPILSLIHSLILNITKFKQITKYNQTNLIIHFDIHFDKCQFNPI